MNLKDHCLPVFQDKLCKCLYSTYIIWWQMLIDYRGFIEKQVIYLRHVLIWIHMN